MKPDFSKGLVPAVIVDDSSGEVLMLAYMNEEAFAKTIETKETWFYSRSRDKLWNKGATSGNRQKVKKVQLDCDKDTLLVRVDPLGPACHTGEMTCFFNEVAGDHSALPLSSVFPSLLEEIQEKKQSPKEGSYTTYLFEKGTDKIAKKLIEEAGEVVIGAKNEDKEELINELSDLFYHSLVLMADQGVSLQEVQTELQKRSSKKGNLKGERPDIQKW